MEKLKQKVASSSSRVIASLQLAATGTFQTNQPDDKDVGQPSSATATAPPSSSAGSSSAAWLMAADATAHLTDAEREILLEVFRKEEQFQRDTIK